MFYSQKNFVLNLYFNYNQNQKYFKLIFENYKVLYTLIIIASLFSLVVEHPLSKREVIGSTPVGGLHFLFLSFYKKI